MTERKTYTIRMHWTTPLNEVTMWNERMAWVMENFGLPGHRYSTHAKADWMDIHFFDEKDATIFKLKFGQYCSE
jgi:hypothetical protein